MDPRIATVIARMENTLEQGASVPALASAVNLSASRLSHLFRREIGVAPGHYLHGLRMRRARTLLEGTFLTVKQVMTRVGVRDPSHFARDFRNYYGVAPSQLKRRPATHTGPPAPFFPRPQHAGRVREPEEVHDAPTTGAPPQAPTAHDRRSRARQRRTKG